MKTEQDPLISRRNPAVSVIIPCFNSAPYLRQAIDSALGNCRVPIEVIVVDDGSTDGSWDVIAGYGNRIRTARQDRGGAYRARNFGTGLAQGEWLAFLDSDDDWLPGKLDAQLALADEGVALVYTDRLNFGDLSRHKERQSDSVKLYEGDVFEPLLTGNFIMLSSVLFSRRWFDRLGGFATERQGVQDWDLWLRLSAGAASSDCADSR
jgi:glycosyltransferase involved in cell wall biosynthesis